MLKKFIMCIVTLATLFITVFSSADVSFVATAQAATRASKNGYLYENGRWTLYQNGKSVSKFGIDVSVWNGKLDWKKIKSQGVDFAMIRVGYRGYGKAGNMKIDSRFEENIKGAISVGMNIGCYFFSQAITVDEAVKEANQAVKWLEPYRKSITYPIAFDTEYYPLADARTNLANLNNRKRTDMALAFVRTIRKSGYTPAVYSDANWYKTKLFKDEIAAECDIWVAHWSSSKVTTFSPFKMWQFTSEGKLTGHSCNFDFNLSLYDYTTLDYKVTYDANGASGKMDPQNCKKGTKYTLKNNAFTKKKAKFIGWKAVRSSDSKRYYTDNKGNFVWASSAPKNFSEYTFKKNESFSNLTAVKNDVITFKAVWEDINFDYSPYDINGDEYLTVSDVRILVLSIAQNNVPTEKFDLYDVNDDGIVSVADARKLLRYVIKYT